MSSDNERPFWYGKAAELQQLIDTGDPRLADTPQWMTDLALQALESLGDDPTDDAPRGR